MSFVSETALLCSLYLGIAGKIGEATGICDTKLFSKTKSRL